MRSWRKFAIAAAMIAAAFGLFTIVTWPGVPLAFAAMSAEQRPALLKDIMWHNPPNDADRDSDKAFRARFHAGVQEAELLAWLEAHRFAVDRASGTARHLIKGFPCAERAEVRWSARAGVLTDARASVSEAGCL